MSRAIGPGLPMGREDKGSVRKAPRGRLRAHDFRNIRPSGGREPAVKERRPGIVSDVGVLLPCSQKYFTSKHHFVCIQLHSKS